MAEMRENAACSKPLRQDISSSLLFFSGQFLIKCAIQLIDNLILLRLFILCLLVPKMEIRHA